MVLGARDGHACVNDRPEAEREDLLTDAEPFDYRQSQADPEVGALAEAFRTESGIKVRDYPRAASPLVAALRRG